METGRALLPRSVRRFAAAALFVVALPAVGEPAAGDDGGWATQLGGRNRDWALGIAADGGGNVYVLGHFQGETRLGGETLDSAGDTDAFLVKLDPEGEVAWARRFGGPGQDEGRGLAATGDGRVLVTGFFSGKADFAGLELESAGASDVFVVSLGGDGAPLWARRIGGGRGDVGYKVAAGADGSALVTGYFQGRVDFDPGPGTAELESAGSTDAFVAVLDREGVYRWARRFGGPRGDQGRAIVAADGGVAVLGNFEATAGKLASAGGADVFLWRLDAAGRELGASRFGGPGPDSGEGLAAAPGGRVYATGSFYASAAFGETLDSAGLADAFVVALDAGGAPLWARRIGGAGSDFGFGIAATDGAVHVAGFHQLAPGEAAVSGEARGFVARLDPRGETLWRKVFTGEPAAQALGLVLDPSAAPCVVGMFKGSAEIDLGPRTARLAGAGKFDVFAACLADG